MATAAISSSRTRDQRRDARPDEAVPQLAAVRVRGGGDPPAGPAVRRLGLDRRHVHQAVRGRVRRAPGGPPRGHRGQRHDGPRRSPSRRSASVRATKSSSRRTRSSRPPARPCMLGAIPVFVDVDPETLLIDPALIDQAVTARTRAIVPVHHGGSPADMDGVMAAARAPRPAGHRGCRPGARRRLARPAGRRDRRYRRVQLPVVQADHRR